MSWDILTMLIGTLGGFETIRYFLDRRTRNRNSEFQLLKELTEFLQEQLKEKEQRFSDQTDLVRELNRKSLDAEKTIADLRIQLERTRCDRLSCGLRKPPNAFTPLPVPAADEDALKTLPDIQQ